MVTKSPLMALAASGSLGQKIRMHEIPDSDSTMAMEQRTVPDDNDFNEERGASAHGPGWIWTAHEVSAVY